MPAYLKLIEKKEKTPNFCSFVVKKLSFHNFFIKNFFKSNIFVVLLFFVRHASLKEEAMALRCRAWMISGRYSVKNKLLDLGRRKDQTDHGGSG